MTEQDRYARLLRRSLGVPVALVSSSRLREPVAIPDVSRESGWSGPAEVDGHTVVAYAAWPLTDLDGHSLGALCAIDSEPREWSEGDLLLMQDLAAACSAELHAADADQLVERARVLLSLSDGLTATRTLQDVAGAVENVALKQLGCCRAGLWLATPQDGAEVLRFVPTVRDDWPSATLHSALDTTTSNPVGEAHQTGAPLYFVDRAAQDARYPWLPGSPDTGDARALMPLSVPGRRLGTLALVWAERRDFSEEDRLTIAALGAYAGQAVERAMLLEERQHTSLVLQRAMLTELPRVPGLTIAARYRPAGTREQVGGDWYDALLLPSGAVGVAIGDVVGHDIEAAADMGQLRTTLRAYAWAGDSSPARTVDYLDGALPGLGLEVLATMLYGRLEPGDVGWTLTWTTAGHPPPVVVDADGRARILPEPDGVMLGLGAGLERQDAVEPIGRGSILLLYSDGLVERRDEAIDDGFERLKAAAVRHRELPVEEFTDAVIADLAEGTQTDDIAVLVVRFER